MGSGVSTPGSVVVVSSGGGGSVVGSAVVAREFKQTEASNVLTLTYCGLVTNITSDRLVVIFG